MPRQIGYLPNPGHYLYLSSILAPFGISKYCTGILSLASTSLLRSSTTVTASFIGSSVMAAPCDYLCYW